MLIHPQFDPVAVHLGSLSIHWYGLTYLAAFLTGYFLALARIKVYPKWTPERVSDLVFYCTLGVILGGRIGYVLFYQWARFIEEPVWLLKVWEGGMSFHGGFIGVLIALAVFAWRQKQNFFDITDFLAPTIPLGLMFGRIGNFINGELWGRVVENPNYPLAMVFPQINDGLARHPSQLYQAFGEGLVLFLLLWFYARTLRPRMAVSAVFLIGYSLARFSVEFFRQPDAGYQLFFDWMSKGQLLSLPMLVFGIAMLIRAYQHRVYDPNYIPPVKPLN